MTLESLPADQDRYNRKAHGYLRVVFAMAVALFVSGVALGVALYLYPPAPPDGSSNISHGNSMCPAVVVAPTLVICNIKLEGEVTFTSGSEKEIPGVVVRTEHITDQTDMTLVRLQTAAPTSSLHQMSAPVAGQRYVAVADRQNWEGTLSDTPSHKWLTPQPAFQLGSGIAVVSPSAGSLVGISAQSSVGAVVVPTQEVLRRFPEVSSGK